MCDRRRGSSSSLRTLLAYELPDPLNLRVEVTEDTGAKIHNKTLCEACNAHQLNLSF
jgi:hypothetical protein